MRFNGLYLSDLMIQVAIFFGQYGCETRHHTHYSCGTENGPLYQVNVKLNNIKLSEPVE